MLAFSKGNGRRRSGKTSVPKSMHASFRNFAEMRPRQNKRIDPHKLWERKERLLEIEEMLRSASRRMARRLAVRHGRRAPTRRLRPTARSRKSIWWVDMSPLLCLCAEGVLTRRCLSSRHLPRAPTGTPPSSRRFLPPTVPPTPRPPLSRRWKSMPQRCWTRRMPTMQPPMPPSPRPTSSIPPS
jgi:hypothetical protein